MTIQLAVCIEMIFADRPFEERIDRVAQSGIQAFEFWDWTSQNLERINALRQSRNLQVAAFVMEPKGTLVSGPAPEVVIEGLNHSIAAARLLQCRNLIVVVGRENPDKSRPEQHDNIVRSLKVAAPIAAEAGIQLILEPLNVKVDHRGFYLSSAEEAFQIVDEVGSSNVKVLLDIYHQQVEAGNLIATLTEHIDKIGYLHAADVPGRHEPGTGEINYPNVLEQVAAAGYRGYLGLEYWPASDPYQSFQAISQIVALINHNAPKR